MINEPILVPVAPHSESLGFLQIDQCRGIVEEAVFKSIGRPIFFDEAVGVLMGRIKARIEKRNLEATANTKEICALAPQLSRIQELAQEEAIRVKREIEQRFVETERLEPPACRSERKTVAVAGPD
jgi:hypothetical protein